MHPVDSLIKILVLLKLILVYVQNNSNQTFSIDFIICLTENPSRFHTLQCSAPSTKSQSGLADVLKGTLFPMQAVLR